MARFFREGQTASNDLEFFPQPLDSFVQRRVRLAVEDVVVLVGNRFPRVPKIQGDQREEFAVAAELGRAGFAEKLQCLLGISGLAFFGFQPFFMLRC